MRILSGTALLVVLNLVTLSIGSSICYQKFYKNTDMSVPIAPSTTTSVADLLALPSVNEEHINDVPIFSRLRQPITTELAASNTPSISNTIPTPPPTPPVLVGVFQLDDGKSWVLLENGEKKKFLTKGNEFSGWTVQKITASVVDLYHKESKTKITTNIPNIGSNTQN